MKSISLALQGGGAHGAFTWGVLDRLLQEKTLHIEAISGTSAGAMNAAALVSGYANGGRAGARESLDEFWNAVSNYAAFSPLRRTWFDQMNGNWGLENSPAYQWSNWLANTLSPYQSNPFNLNPLRDVLKQQINMDAIHSCNDDIRVFIAATNVRTGRARIFTKDDLSLNALLASACLPQMYQAIEIDGEHYWDGGYMGNPSIWPLIYEAKTADVVLVQINPLERPELPTTVDEINHRLNEITFNSSLNHEMRAISFVQRLLDEGALKEPWAKKYKRMRMHMIADSDAIASLGASSKMNVEAEFMHHLKTMGVECAEKWLEENMDSLGVESTLNIQEAFLS